MAGCTVVQLMLPVLMLPVLMQQHCSTGVAACTSRGLASGDAAYCPSRQNSSVDATCH